MHCASVDNDDEVILILPMMVIVMILMIIVVMMSGTDTDINVDLDDVHDNCETKMCMIVKHR